MWSDFLDNTYRPEDITRRGVTYRFYTNTSVRDYYHSHHCSANRHRYVRKMCKKYGVPIRLLIHKKAYDTYGNLLDHHSVAIFIHRDDWQIYNAIPFNGMAKFIRENVEMLESLRGRR